jgi:CheY-like chemotaxis protein
MHESSHTTVFPELGGIHVLCVDDDEDIREAFQAVLEHHGATVRTAGSAREALAALELSRPDVLLCDLCMPDGDGYELMRKVAARDPTLPAAAITALSDRGLAHAAGFKILLSKPVDTALLIAAVSALAGPRARAGQARRAAAWDP